MKFAPSALIILSSVASLISTASVKPIAGTSALPKTADVSATSTGNGLETTPDVFGRLRIFVQRLENNTQLREDILQASKEMGKIHNGLNLDLSKLSLASVTKLPTILMKMPGDALKIGKKVTEVFKNHQNEIASLVKTDAEIEAEKEKPHVQRRFMLVHLNRYIFKNIKNLTFV